MDKITNTTINNIIDESISANTDPVWSKDNEALIEKLELAYQATPEEISLKDNNQFFGIKLNKLRLLIDQNTPSELLEKCSIHPIPLTTSWIVGVKFIATLKLKILTTIKLSLLIKELML